MVRSRTDTQSPCLVVRPQPCLGGRDAPLPRTASFDVNDKQLLSSTMREGVWRRQAAAPGQARGGPARRQAVGSLLFANSSRRRPGHSSDRQPRRSSTVTMKGQKRATLVSWGVAASDGEAAAALSRCALRCSTGTGVRQSWTVGSLGQPAVGGI